MQKQILFIPMKHIDYYQVFLVAGGWDGSSYLSSTETLVEGGQAWNFQQPLPFFRYAFQGISLPNTVIMIGKIVLTFTFEKINPNILTLMVNNKIKGNNFNLFTRKI